MQNLKKTLLNEKKEFLSISFVCKLQKILFLLFYCVCLGKMFCW